ncbi:CHASE3 domain-containing protein [Microcoleus sp. FACHB-1515]|uniref:sensor histidine kinase n=1 Tax=Cyanophyceae TaxID=3028117 RepID=UPI001686647D|nr:CHASE3 domain-containing protein [Microcoleus sp. FACHB-1515]MBD2088726.1 CHASE3 domain-containing protein [Microcoleus sp. FACHB-1515]
MTRRSPARYIHFGLITALLLLISTAATFYYHIHRLQANEQAIQHSYQVRSSLDAVLSTLKDAETGQRGYIITGEAQYLEPYQTAIAQIDAQLGELRTLVSPSDSLTAHDSQQQARLAQVETTIEARLAVLRSAIEARRKSGETAAEEMVRSGQGKALMDSTRQQIAAMQRQETDRLAQAQQDSAASFQQAIDAVTIALALNLLLLGLVYALFRRDRHLRSQEDDRQQQLISEIEAQRRQLEAVVQNLPVGTMIAEARSGRIILGNQQVELILGHDFFGSDISKRSDKAFHLDGRLLEPEEYPLARALLTGETILDQEILYQQEDGSFRVIRASATPIRDRGEIVAGVVAFYDITPLRKAQEEVQQLNASLEQRVQERTAQLQEANEEMEAFSYSVAHDLRAPLRGMQGFAEALLEDYGDRLDSEGREYAQFIIASAQRLETLIQDLLAYSRLSRAELPLRAIDLNGVVAEAIQQLENDLIRSQAQMIIQFNLPSVTGHRSTLIQVVSNLISNAVKFVAEGVRPKVEISAEKQGDRVRLWVIDNGIGIEDKYYSRIFRVFERLHGVEAYPGTGVGLAIVRKGTERMGGSVGVESKLDAGSRFWIELKES